MISREKVIELWQNTCKRDKGIIVLVIGSINEPKTIMIEIMTENDDPQIIFNAMGGTSTKNLHLLTASALNQKSLVAYQMITKDANQMLRNMINEMIAEIVGISISEHPLVK